MSGFLDEKSNRTIELIFTSLPTSHLIVSKLITMIAVGLTMLTTWIAIGVLAVLIGANYLNFNWMRDISLDWKMLGTILMVALPSYVFAAALMLGIGLLLGNSQEAESIGPLFFIAAFIPLWFIVPITQDINGLIDVLLSLLPISSILTIGLRGIFIEIPIWQLFLSVGIQLVLITAALWFAIRTFQIGLLRTGGRIRWNELFLKNRRKVVEERE
jgi:ABC-2 type transport system permease protein